jgi:hypothetical protein
MIYVFLWLLFAMPSYLVLRGLKTRGAWSRGDLVASVIVSTVMGPIITVIYILSYLPWATLTEILSDWLDKPTRW